jgi:hypothetical protein
MMISFHLLSYCKHKIYHYLTVSILCFLLPCVTRTGRTHAVVETLWLYRIHSLDYDLFLHYFRRHFSLYFDSPIEQR